MEWNCNKICANIEQFNFNARPSFILIFTLILDYYHRNEREYFIQQLVRLCDNMVALLATIKIKINFNSIE